MIVVLDLGKMGISYFRKRNDLICIFWVWCFENNMWLIISYILGKENILVDVEFRKFRKEIEWILDRWIFYEVVKKFYVEFQIDLFVFRFNYQLRLFVVY